MNLFRLVIIGFVVPPSVLVFFPLKQIYMRVNYSHCRFSETLDGVVLAYDPKNPSDLARILPGIHPYFGVRIEAKLLLFHPKPNMLLGSSATLLCSA